MACQLEDHYAKKPYSCNIKFSEDDVTTMFDDPKMMVHGLHHRYCGDAEMGIREFSDAYDDRGQKRSDGSYDTDKIKYNRNNASNMMAQYLTNQKKTYITNYEIETYDIDSENDDSENDKNMYGLEGKIVIDCIEDDNFDEYDYELACVRFHTDNACVELTLNSYGYKFEACNYEWIVSHFKSNEYNIDYNNHEWVLSELPKYNFMNA
jgi:hypothetical protein